MNAVDPSLEDLRRGVRWILALGFLTAALPLVVSAVVGLSYMRTLEQSAEHLAAEQLQSVGMLERVRRGKPRSGS